MGRQIREEAEGEGEDGSGRDDRAGAGKARD
jgi:hypothetical protein